jgi:hypothetical protein
MLTTSRFVDVPIVVVMPPIRIAKLTGINVCEADVPRRAARVRSTGITSTSTGVSLMNMLIPPQTSMVQSRPSPLL